VRLLIISCRLFVIRVSGRVCGCEIFGPPIGVSTLKYALAFCKYRESAVAQIPRRIMIRLAADDGYARVGVPRKLHKDYLILACVGRKITSALH
jgi:hypothetical protein